MRPAVLTLLKEHLKYIRISCGSPNPAVITFFFLQSWISLCSWQVANSLESVCESVSEWKVIVFLLSFFLSAFYVFFFPVVYNKRRHWNWYCGLQRMWRKKNFNDDETIQKCKKCYYISTDKALITYNWWSGFTCFSGICKIKVLRLGENKYSIFCTEEGSNNMRNVQCWSMYMKDCVCVCVRCVVCFWICVLVCTFMLWNEGKREVYSIVWPSHWGTKPA